MSDAAEEALRRIQNLAMEHMNCSGCPTPWWLKQELSRDLPSKREAGR
jgi:hypothetical protein